MPLHSRNDPLLQIKSARIGKAFEPLRINFQGFFRILQIIVAISDQLINQIVAILVLIKCFGEFDRFLIIPFDHIGVSHLVRQRPIVRIECQCLPEQHDTLIGITVIHQFNSLPLQCEHLLAVVLSE